MNRAAYDIFPFALDEEGPFSILQQLESIHHPTTRAAERIQVLFGASRYLDHWDPGAHGWDEWTENFRAAQTLGSVFQLHPREVYQLQRLEFNPRFRRPLSDGDLWDVIQAGVRTSCCKVSGLPDDPKRKIQLLQPKAPQWMGDRNNSHFWVPEPEKGDRWIEEVARKASPHLTNFAGRILSMRSWREHAATGEGPPLQDHPLLGSEVATALGLSSNEVEDRLFELVGAKLIATMDLCHVPGIYSNVLAPNQFD